MTVRRLSSRSSRPLDRAYLAQRLRGAVSYDRIAGYFRSSVFEVAGEAFEGVAGSIRIVCNSGLDPVDVATAQAQRTEWCEGQPERMAEAQRPRYERLARLLRDGKVAVKVLPDEVFGLIHGKAGVLRYADRPALAFLGSVNETGSAWSRNYELLWEDDDPAAVAWVQEEFNDLWKHVDARDLSQAIVEDVERILRRTVVPVERWDRFGQKQAPFIEAPVARQGNGLAPHQQAFVAAVAAEIETFGHARLLLADDVGLGKTIQLGMAAEYVALTSPKPVLVLAPKNLLPQWQGELRTMLGVPSARWEAGKWITEDAAVWPGEPDTCPRRIGLFPTSMITAGAPISDRLMRLRFGCLVLDEAHRARNRAGLGRERTPNRLRAFMLEAAANADTVLLGTATPIQLDRLELFELMEILNAGCGRVLGSSPSPWVDGPKALDAITGRLPAPASARLAWAWLRDPLIPRGEHRLASWIRDALDVADAVTRVPERDFDRLSPQLRQGLEFEVGHLISQHNPFVRHVIKRRRKDLKGRDGLPLFKAIRVNLHGEAEEDALAMPDGMAAAYASARRFCELVARRRPGGGILKTLLLRRIGSSLRAGLITAERLLDRERRIGLAAEDDEPADLLPDEGISEDADDYEPEADELALLEQAFNGLRDAGDNDPKLQRCLRALRDDGWAERGCILFSQYYDTVDWFADRIAQAFPGGPVGVYAGFGKTCVIKGADRQRVDRTEIQEMVKARSLKLLVATDAAAEGLNLQRLQTLINIDLPWNPSRLEQRKGRIERIGQEADVIDLLNLRYCDSVEDEVHAVLSGRLKEIQSVFGTLPDMLEDAWIQAALGDREAARRLIEAVPRHSFDIRYTEHLPDTDWNRCEQVLNRHDLVDALRLGWRR